MVLLSSQFENNAFVGSELLIAGNCLNNSLSLSQKPGFLLMIFLATLLLAYSLGRYVNLGSADVSR